MRYILFIAAFLISSLAYGQGTWNKSSTNNAWNRTKADSVAIVPRDTSATNNAILPSTGQPVGDYGRIQAKHGLFYFHDSIRNRRMAFYDDIVGGGFVSVPQLTDSLNQRAAFYELVANKATNLTSPDNTKYPTTLAVSNAIAAIPVPNLQSVMGAGNTTTIDLVRNNGSVSNVFSASASAGVIGTTTNHSLGLYTNNLESFRLHRSGAAGSVLIPTRASSFLADDGISALQVKGTSVFARAATTGGVYSHMRLSDENNSPRWEFGTLAGDGSSNTGFDFIIRGFDNSGTLIPTVPFFLRRDDGSIGLGTIAQAGVRLTVNGETTGNPALNSNQYVTRSQVTDTITTRLSAYSPGIPTLGQVTTAGNTTTNTVVIGNHTFGTSRVLINSAVDDGTSAVQVKGKLRLNSAANNDLIIGDNASGFGANIIQALPLTFSTSNTERIRISADGNVGIGTATPQSDLVVYDAAGGGTAGIEFRSIGSSSGTISYYDRTANVYKPVSLIGESISLSTGTSSHSTKVTVTTGGLVGIGTTSPSSSLHVNGSFAAVIDPTIHTSNFTVGDYYTTIVNNGSGAIAITLPSASSCPDRIIQLKITSNANAVTVDGSNVNMAWAPSPNGPLCIMQSNGTNWIFLQGF